MIDAIGNNTHECTATLNKFKTDVGTEERHHYIIKANQVKFTGSKLTFIDNDETFKFSDDFLKTVTNTISNKKRDVRLVQNFFR